MLPIRPIVVEWPTPQITHRLWSLYKAGKFAPHPEGRLSIYEFAFCLIYKTMIYKGMWSRFDHDLLYDGLMDAQVSAMGRLKARSFPLDSRNAFFDTFTEHVYWVVRKHIQHEARLADNNVVLARLTPVAYAYVDLEAIERRDHSKAAATTAVDYLMVRFAGVPRAVIEAMVVDWFVTGHVESVQTYYSRDTEKVIPIAGWSVILDVVEVVCRVAYPAGVHESAGVADAA